MGMEFACVDGTDMRTKNSSGFPPQLGSPVVWSRTIRAVMSFERGSLSMRSYEKP
jgi:hypothetical protein